jgi:hypothetical protein
MMEEKDSTMAEQMAEGIGQSANHPLLSLLNFFEDCQ